MFSTPARLLSALGATTVLTAALALGAGPVPSVEAASALRFTTFVADPAGKDDRTNAHINREKISVKNTGRSTVTLSGYTIRDKQNHSFTFPKNTTVKPGKTVTVHTGKGTNGSGRFYWGQGNYVWNNTPGDTATLRSSGGSVQDTCTFTASKHPSGTTTC
ncbi:Competence-like protein [Serinicoccus hydrothermalis]|uniref:Competence-like protein n=1 Tax=Serinicoccus hydrothermalis TaxID=1758689 RepID=A0A1B1NDC3_9MICO|nr:lamin tail domain-containing protein [Serinicoccus hydrothermalis]ANS79432.1 Competence-like protein [Serinicoccus hydrothermalis]